MVLEMAMQAVDAIRDYVVPAQVEIKKAGVGEAEEGKVEGSSSPSIVTASLTHSKAGTPLPVKIRVLGHSAGKAYTRTNSTKKK